MFLSLCTVNPALFSLFVNPRNIKTLFAMMQNPHPEPTVTAFVNLKPPSRNVEHICIVLRVVD